MYTYFYVCASKRESRHMKLTRTKMLDILNYETETANFYSKNLYAVFLKLVFYKPIIIIRMAWVDFTSVLRRCEHLVTAACYLM